MKILLKEHSIDEWNSIGLFVWKTSDKNQKEFVVWTFPKNDPTNTYWGHYFDTIDDALNYFNRKAVSIETPIMPH